jgi:hypothetical protein
MHSTSVGTVVKSQARAPAVHDQLKRSDALLSLTCNKIAANFKFLETFSGNPTIMALVQFARNFTHSMDKAFQFEF